MRRLERAPRRVRAATGIALALALASAATPTEAASGSEWPAYLNGPAHHSTGKSASITPANVGSLAATWTWKPAVIEGRPSPRM